MKKEAHIYVHQGQAAAYLHLEPVDFFLGLAQVKSSQRGVVSLDLLFSQDDRSIIDRLIPCMIKARIEPEVYYFPAGEQVMVSVTFRCPAANFPDLSDLIEFTASLGKTDLTGEVDFSVRLIDWAAFLSLASETGKYMITIADEITESEVKSSVITELSKMPQVFTNHIDFRQAVIFGQPLKGGPA